MVLYGILFYNPNNNNNNNNNINNNESNDINSILKERIKTITKHKLDS